MQRAFALCLSFWISSILLTVPISAVGEEQITVMLDQGRFRATMPAKTISSYNINTAAKVYVDPTVMLLFSTMRLTKEGIDVASKNPIEYLTAVGQEAAAALAKKDGESIVTLQNSVHPAIEQRFQTAPSAEFPAGYVVSRSYYVAGRVCTSLVHLPKDIYENKSDAAQLVLNRFLDSVVIDKTMPAGHPFTYGATPRANWVAPGAEVVQRFAAAQGMLTENFAICQTMPLDEFYWVAEELRACGYRPVTFRPHVAKDEAMVAALWTRDGGGWILVSGRTREELSHIATEMAATSNPVDVATWQIHNGLYFGVLWHLAIPERGVNKLLVGELDSDYGKLAKQIGAAGYRARRRHCMLGSDGLYRQSLIAYKPRPNPGLWHIRGDHVYYEKELRKNRIPYEISLGVSEKGKVEYTASFSNSPTPFKESHGLPPEAHLRSCQQFASQGMHPVALSITHKDGGGTVAASIWHRRFGEP